MCDNYWATRIFCKFVQAWSQWSNQKRNAEAQTVVCSVKHNYLEAELEEKKKSSFLCLPTFAFLFLDNIFTRNQKLSKQEKPNETNTS